MTKFIVYVLLCDQGRYYIGSTDNLQKRIEQHHTKALKSWTNRYDNWKVVYFEEYATRKSAESRERQIKRYKGGRAFKKLLDQSKR